MNARMNPLSMNAHMNLMWMNTHMELHCLLRNTFFMGHYKCLTTNPQPPSWGFESVNLCCQKLKYLVASCTHVNPQASSVNPTLWNPPMKILNSIHSESPHQYSILQWKFFHQASQLSKSFTKPTPPSPHQTKTTETCMEKYMEKQKDAMWKNPIATNMQPTTCGFTGLWLRLEIHRCILTILV